MSLVSSCPTNLIPIPPKLSCRFYEPIILTKALNLALVHNQVPISPELTSDVEQSPKQLYCNFINKLAQLCDNKPGGATVAALTVLQFPDCVQYRFAFNQQKQRELDAASLFVTEILKTICRENGKASQEMTSFILQRALIFNRRRVEGYLTTLNGQVDQCIDACERENNYECKRKITF